jgi:3-oxoacyl-[acyl-carrier-protein] synthase II
VFASALPVRRVVVTGMGCVTSLGHDKNTFYDNLLAGKSGISTITRYDPEKYEIGTNIAGEIKDFDPTGWMTLKMSRRVDPFIAYMVVACKRALADAGLPEGSDAVKALDVARAGALVGSAMGGMHSFAGAVEAMTFQGHKKMNPFCIPFAITNMGAALAAMDLGFMGPNYSISSACASGNFCIQNAADHIRRGDADLMLAGASDAAILPIGMSGFSAARALSRRNDDPATASRPWDTDRDGFVMGEGAGVLVLEEYEHAKARGAHILAEYLGGSYTCDAHHMTEPRPDGKGVQLAIENALKSSGVSRDRVTYVNAHGTSTPAGDMAEYKAIRASLPGPRVRINSTKSMIGHLLGAAGAVEAVACVMALQTGKLHPNPNLINPDPEVDLAVVVGRTALTHEMDVVLSNSFGFGGHNSCIVFGKAPK